LRKEDTLLDMTQIRVVVIDSQRTFADALAARLAAETGLIVAGAAESVVSVHRLLAGRCVDIALLDAELPEGIHPAAELAHVRTTAPQPIRVIMLGTQPEAACRGGAAREDRRMGVEREVDCQQRSASSWRSDATSAASTSCEGGGLSSAARPQTLPGSAPRALSTTVRKVRQKWLFIGFGPRWLGESTFWPPFARLPVCSSLSVQLPLLMQQLSVRRTGLSISTARATTLTIRPRHL
jgi:hypothetical protein